MIVPQYWAEAKLRQRHQQKGQITLRRFGWSNTSQADAQRMAEERVADAMARHNAGEPQIERSEAKTPYNGADGVPIREEVIDRIGETVITRNSYGALCLNTPNVLFADVDVAQRHYGLPYIISTVSFILLSAGLMWQGFVWYQALLLACALVVLLEITVSKVVQTTRRMRYGSLDQQAMHDLKAFAREHPGWLLRIYRTPNGFRALAMHDVFEPESPEVADFFQAIKTDPVYVRMCQRQKCFRARLTPKPWRIGMEQHLKPRPGVWPINPERLPERERWMRDYEHRSQGYAACAYETTLGQGRTHPDAETVQIIHDEYCRAEASLPIA